MKKCFTINPLRKTEDFLGYQSILKERIFDAIEIFYPEKEETRAVYAENVRILLKENPHLEVVFHLPFNRDNDLCSFQKNEQLIDKFKKIMVFAKSFGVKKLTMHLGYVSIEVDRSLYLKNIVKTLKELCVYASKLDLRLMIENMPDNKQLGYAPDEILEIIKLVDLDNLGFIYDTGHAHISEFPDLLYLDVLGKWLWHCHLNDNHGHKDEHYSFGKGNYDFDAFFRKTKDINFQGCYCLEMLFDNANDLENYAKSFDEITKVVFHK
ncbi:MAG: sugar phosphate isomerase/epimerase family protein [Bacilli bacterium]